MYVLPDIVDSVKILIQLQLILVDFCDIGAKRQKYVYYH